MILLRISCVNLVFKFGAGVFVVFGTVFVGGAGAEVVALVVVFVLVLFSY